MAKPPRLAYESANPSPREYLIPKAPPADSRGGFPNRVWSDSRRRRGLGHAVSGEIARGLLGRGDSGFGPAVEDRQPEPSAFVAGCGSEWNGSRGGGEDRRHGPADLARLGPPLQRVGAGGPDRQLDGWPQTAPVG